ncbi:MAG: ester cyclase [Bacteroidota bacterium]
MQFTTEQNKQSVIRFNKEFIEQGNINAFNELIADDVINHSAPAGASKGPDSMLYFLQHILKAGFPDIQVEILDQIAEGDKVTTRKVFHGTHTGEIMGITPSNKKVTIHVIDIIRLRDGKYIEHWGASNFSDIIKEISMP